MLTRHIIVWNQIEMMAAWCRLDFWLVWDDRDHLEYCRTETVSKSTVVRSGTSIYRSKMMEWLLFDLFDNVSFWYRHWGLSRFRYGYIKYRKKTDIGNCETAEKQQTGYHTKDTAGYHFWVANAIIWLMMETGCQTLLIDRYRCFSMGRNCWWFHPWTW